jgi:hypothetical protein
MKKEKRVKAGLGIALTGYKKSWLVLQFVKVFSSNYFCSQGKLIGSEAATLFIPHR